jgi:hypothetical protein
MHGNCRLCFDTRRQVSVICRTPALLQSVCNNRTTSRVVTRLKTLPKLAAANISGNLVAVQYPSYFNVVTYCHVTLTRDLPLQTAVQHTQHSTNQAPRCTAAAPVAVRLGGRGRQHALAFPARLGLSGGQQPTPRPRGSGALEFWTLEQKARPAKKSRRKTDEQRSSSSIGAEWTRWSSGRAPMEILPCWSSGRAPMEILPCFPFTFMECSLLPYR